MVVVAVAAGLVAVAVGLALRRGRATPPLR